MAKNQLQPNSTDSNALTIPRGGAASRSDQQRAIAEVQAAMVVAQGAPRNTSAAIARILAECDREDLALDGVYEYSRGGTEISGPSIALAKALARNWGNLAYGIREIEQEDGASTIQAYCWDMETNTRSEVTFHVPHVRDTKRGRFNLTDARDIYETVANAGARRLRACILGIIPADVADMAVKHCDSVLAKSVDLSPAGMEKLLAAFAKLGVTQKQIEERIQRVIDKISVRQFVRLRRIYASIRDGMSSRENWFTGPFRTAEVRTEGHAAENVDAEPECDSEGEIISDEEKAAIEAAEAAAEV